MGIFNFGKKSIVTHVSAVNRANVLDDGERQRYSTELLDTYQGFGLKYIQAQIKGGISSETIRNSMYKLAVCFPLLKDFVDKISMVYRRQPVRSFYLDGKLIVDQLPSDQEFINEDKYEVNESLFNKLNEIYNREFAMRIKSAEEKTNLLSTTIYKINNRYSNLTLDFIANDLAAVFPDVDDNAKMNSIVFQKGLTINDTNAEIYYEYWTPEIYQLLEGESTKTENINRAVEEYRKYTDNEYAKYIGDGFPPFIVLRSELSDLDFWNLQDHDTMSLIKEINVAFTELRYLQRYGSFGLKYLLNAKLPTNQTMDLVGMIEIETQNSTPTNSKDNNDTKIGEFKNEGRLEQLGDSIFKMLQLLFSVKNITVDRLITTKQATTAESKQIDNESLKEQIEKQQEIWAINEENIFNTAIMVYNRDNGNDKLPKGLEISVDFYDSQLTAEEASKEIENWLVKIDNDIKTRVDWIRKDNPDLDEKDAELVYNKNKSINEGDKAEEGKQEVNDEGNNE